MAGRLGLTVAEYRSLEAGGLWITCDVGGCVAAGLWPRRIGDLRLLRWTYARYVRRGARRSLRRSTVAGSVRHDAGHADGAR
jgi:hypothetical protein